MDRKSCLLSAQGLHIVDSNGLLKDFNPKDAIKLIKRSGVPTELQLIEALKEDREKNE